MNPTHDETLAWYESLFRAAAGFAPPPAAPHVVYHVAGMGGYWRKVVAEQLGQLAAAGLTRVLCTHVGTGRADLPGLARAAGVELTVTSSDPDVKQYERPGVRLVRRLAEASDTPVLYLHSKGVSHPPTEPVWHEWRRLMMRELVGGWHSCFARLLAGEYDAAGVNWWEGKPHFSGNFWMASAAWLRSLPDPDAYYRDRFSCERWVGARPGCRALSLVCRDRKFWADDREFLFAAARGPGGIGRA